MSYLGMNLEMAASYFRLTTSDTEPKVAGIRTLTLAFTLLLSVIYVCLGRGLQWNVSDLAIGENGSKMK